MSICCTISLHILFVNMANMRNNRQISCGNRRCPFCNNFFPNLITLFLHCIRIHLELQCRICGVARVGYVLLVRHFLQFHMMRNISSPMDLIRIGFRLRDIPLCHASLDDMQKAADSLSQFLLRHGYTTSNVTASIVQLIITQFATQGGSNSVPSQIDQNIIVTSMNQSPVTAESSQQEHTEFAENHGPGNNQLYDRTDEMIHLEDNDTDDEESG